MKFELGHKEAVITGDIQNNNVSIDVNNIDFLVTILSTSLYSKPIESFVREITSNAWDSHVEAGVTEPVILELGKDADGKHFCRIQDFGVGLSPERFDSIYRNIGSSTKRDSNAQIGGFGIGRFSALAYSDTVHITSNHDGIQYKYLMYKDGNTISIDLLHDMPTTERNGVEVMLYIKPGDTDNFRKAIRQQLVYFENLYVEDNAGGSLGEKFNKFLIKRYENFAVNSLDGNNEDVNILLGKVKYPLRMSALNKKYPEYVSEYPISLIFEIGDLEVTPNREEILYSAKNVRMIEEKLDKSLEVINEMIDEYKHKDFDDVKKFYNAIVDGGLKVPLLQNEDTNEILVSIKLQADKMRLTLDGEYYKPKPFKRTYEAITDKSLIATNYGYTGGKITYVSKFHSIRSMMNSTYTHFYFSDVSLLNNMSKNYIREKFESSSYFFDMKRDMKSYFREYMNSLYRDIKTNKYSYKYEKDEVIDIKMAKLILRYFAKKIPTIYQRFDNSTVPLQYIADKKEEARLARLNRKSSGIDWSEFVNLFELELSNRGKDGVIAPSTAYKMDTLRQRFKKTVIYGERGDERLRQMFKAFYHVKRLKFVEIAPTKVKLLKNIENFISIEDIMNADHRIIRKIATARLIQNTLPFLDDISKVENIGLVSVKLGSLIKRLSDYTSKYLRNMNTEDDEKFFDEILSVCEEKGYFDEVYKAKLMGNLSLLQNSEILLLFAQKDYYNSHRFKIPEERLNVLTDYILARKLFRPDVQAVYKLRTETILNKKHESNQSTEALSDSVI